MKKTILILGLIITIPANATTMCAVNDTVAVVLDPSIGGTNNGNDNTLSTWWTQFPYGRIEGISACIDTDWGKSRGGTVSKLTDMSGNRVVGGEKTGQYCWCKLTHPVASLWAFLTYRDGCTLNCPMFCGSSVGYYTDLRECLYSSVAN